MNESMWTKLRSDVFIIGHGIPQVPLVGMKIADCGDNIDLLKDVTNVATLLHSVCASMLELNEVGQQLVSHARHGVRIVPVTLRPPHSEFRMMS